MDSIFEYFERLIYSPRNDALEEQVPVEPEAEEPEDERPRKRYKVLGAAQRASVVTAVRLGKTPSMVGKIMGIHHTTVSRIAKLYDHRGNLLRKPSFNKEPAKKRRN